MTVRNSIESGLAGAGIHCGRSQGRSKKHGPLPWPIRVPRDILPALYAFLPVDEDDNRTRLEGTKSWDFLDDVASARRFETSNVLGGWRMSWVSHESCPKRGNRSFKQEESDGSQPTFTGANA